MVVPVSMGELFLQTYLFLNQKARSMFHQRKRPAKLAWTAQFRKAHKKVRRSDIATRPAPARASSDPLGQWVQLQTVTSSAGPELAALRPRRSRCNCAGLVK